MTFLRWLRVCARANVLLPLFAIAGIFILVGVLARPDSAIQKDESEVLSIRAVSAKDHIRGSVNAPIHLIVFADPECPYCKLLDQSVIPALELQFGDSIAVVYRHRLVARYTRSLREAKAMECAALLGGNDAFWKYTENIFKITASDDSLDPAELFAIATRLHMPIDEFTKCLESQKIEERIGEDVVEASIAGIRVSPTVVVVRADGTRHLVVPGSSYVALRAAVQLFLNSFPQK